MTQVFTALAIGCLISGSAVSAVEDANIGLTTVTNLQAIVNDVARSTGTVGAQVSVMVGDRRADFIYGIANAELNTPMTVDTVVQIGSLTKVFNAAIVMSLVDEGKLAIDTPVTRYIPDLKLGGKPAEDNVTLRRLLSMSAGLDFGPTEGFVGENAIGRWIATLSDIPLSYPTGQGFGYSNASVCTAAYAAEKVTGLPWDTLLKKRILEPAGLTQVASAPADLAYVRVAVGHTSVQEGQPTKVFRPWFTNESQNPSGSGLPIAISAHDLVSFGQLFINGGKAANGTRVLSEAAVNAMMTPTTRLPMGVPHWGTGDRWGLGPTLSTWGDTEVWGHGGSALGGSSLLIWIPKKQAVLAFTVNSPMAFERFAARLMTDLTQPLLGIHAPAPPVAPAKPVRVDHPERLVGTYMRSGDRIEISQQAGRLRFKEFNEALTERYQLMKEKIPAGPLLDVELIALGGDKFLLTFPGFENGIPVFFFGKDAKGRATNITSGLRTSRRTEPH